MRLLKKQHSPSVSNPLGNMTDSKAPHPAKEYAPNSLRDAGQTIDFNDVHL